MARDNYIFTSESVSEGHPDKVCDRISDSILDAFLSEEPEARVACETFATTNRVVIGGEVGLSDQSKLKDYMGRVEDIARACCCLSRTTLGLDKPPARISIWHKRGCGRSTRACRWSAWPILVSAR